MALLLCFFSAVVPLYHYNMSGNTCTVYSQNNLSFGSIVLVRYLSIFSTIGVYLQIEILYHLVSFNYICTVHSLVCKDFLHTLEFYDCKNGISRTVLPACFFFPKWLDCDKYFIVVLLCKFYPIISSVLVKEKFSKKVRNIYTILFSLLTVSNYQVKDRNLLIDKLITLKMDITLKPLQ